MSAPNPERTFNRGDRIRVIKHSRIEQTKGAIGEIVEVLDKPSSRGKRMYTVRLDCNYEALGFGDRLVVDEDEIEAVDKT